MDGAGRAPAGQSLHAGLRGPPLPHDCALGRQLQVVTVYKNIWSFCAVYRTAALPVFAGLADIEGVSHYCCNNAQLHIWAIKTAFTREYQGGAESAAPSLKCVAGTPSLLGLKIIVQMCMLISSIKLCFCEKFLKY